MADNLADKEDMSKRLWDVVLVLLLVLIAGTHIGCMLFAGAAAGVVGVVYTKGDLTGYVDADLTRTVGATKLAMNDLKLPLISANSGGDEGRVEARVGTDNKAVVRLIQKSEKVTKVNIRIGTFGDEELSRQILAKVESHLNDPSLRPSAMAP